jgi:hypothetical protein
MERRWCIDSSELLVVGEIWLAVAIESGQLALCASARLHGPDHQNARATADTALEDWHVAPRCKVRAQERQESPRCKVRAQERHENENEQQRTMLSSGVLSTSPLSVLKVDRNISDEILSKALPESNTTCLVRGNTRHLVRSVPRALQAPSAPGSVSKHCRCAR